MNASTSRIARTLRQLSDERADARILEVALAHKLVSSQTSLVAVDRTPSRPEGAPLVRADLPLNLPAGWDFEALFGDTVLPKLEQAINDMFGFGGAVDQLG